MREGAYDYISKPVELPALVVRVEHALSRRSLEMENVAYQQRLEQIVDQLNARLEGRQREIEALKKLYDSRTDQREKAHRALVRLQGSLAAFSAEVDELATIVGLVGQSADDSVGSDDE